MREETIVIRRSESEHNARRPPPPAACGRPSSRPPVLTLSPEDEQLRSFDGEIIRFDADLLSRAKSASRSCSGSSMDVVRLLRPMHAPARAVIPAAR